MSGPGHQTDFQLIQRYRRGAPEAMEELVERYQQRLFGFVCKAAASRQEAEDIYQETWLRIVKNIDRYHDQCFSAWLFRIARNLMIDRRRAWRDIASLDRPNEAGGTLQDILGVFQQATALLHGGKKIVGGEKIGGAGQDLFRQQRCFFQGATVAQRRCQAHLHPGRHAPFQHLAKERFGLFDPFELQQQLALETIGVVHVGRVLVDDTVAGGDGFIQVAAFDFFVDAT